MNRLILGFGVAFLPFGDLSGLEDGPGGPYAFPLIFNLAAGSIWVWLIREILKSNVNVARIILYSQASHQPHHGTVPGLHEV